jgi:transcriptional regulator with XRE-family HTH domain
MLRNIIGKRIRLARKNLNPPLTQEKLAAKLEASGFNISRDIVAKIETGEREVNDIEIMAFAKILKVPIESLFDKQLFETVFKGK